MNVDMSQRRWIYRAAAGITAAALGAGGLTVTASEAVPAAAENDGSPEDTAYDAAALSETGQAGEDAGKAAGEKAEEITEELSLAVTGDILLSYVRANYDAGGLDGIICTSLQEELTGADITYVNQEFPLGVGGTQAVKTYTFKEDPSYVAALTGLGADVVSLANNHTLDYGQDVLLQTFDTLDNAGIAYVGAGNSLEEASDWETIEANGTSVGFLAASYIDPISLWDVSVSQPGIFNGYDMDTLLEQIIWAKEANDLVVVYLHWGYEYTNTPVQYQRDVAMACIDAGADLIIGAHPHQLQGIEYYNGTPIFYSLGNFIFSMRTQDTVLLKVTADGERQLTFRLVPARCTGGYTDQVYGEDAQEILDYIESISFGVAIDEEGYVSPAPLF